MEDWIKNHRILSAILLYSTIKTIKDFILPNIINSIEYKFGGRIQYAAKDAPEVDLNNAIENLEVWKNSVFFITAECTLKSVDGTGFFLYNKKMKTYWFITNSHVVQNEFGKARKIRFPSSITLKNQSSENCLDIDWNNIDNYFHSFSPANREYFRYFPILWKVFKAGERHLDIFIYNIPIENIIFNNQIPILETKYVDFTKSMGAKVIKITKNQANLAENRFPAYLDKLESINIDLGYVYHNSRTDRGNSGSPLLTDDYKFGGVHLGNLNPDNSYIYVVNIGIHSESLFSEVLQRKTKWCFHEYNNSIICEDCSQIISKCPSKSMIRSKCFIVFILETIKLLF